MAIPMMIHATAEATRWEPDKSLEVLIARARQVLHDESVTAAERVRRVAALLKVCDCLNEQHAHEGTGSRKKTGGLSGWQVQRVRTFIATSFDKPVSIAELAAVARISSSHFSRAFRITFEEPPHRYLLRLRLERSLALLSETDRSLCEVATDSGFSDQAHFNRVFKQRLVGSPGAWRRANSIGARAP